MGKPVNALEAQNAQTLIDKWALEYEKGGIPSSVRTTPSGSVVWAVRELQRQNIPLRTAADVGCGKGRNSLYLAVHGVQVTAMDFTPIAIERLQKKATTQKLDQKIRALVQDVTEEWPVAPASMDLVVDAFCFKHIAPYEARLTYKQSLLRALRSRGHYLISFASVGDGYYGQYVVERNAVDSEEEYLVADPVNNIESTLYTKQQVVQFFGPELMPFMELHHEKPSVMHGKEYPRSTYALLLHRNPHQLFG